MMVELVIYDQIEILGWMGYIRTEAFDTIIYHHTTPSEGGGEIVIYDQIKLFTEKGCRKTFERPL